MKIINFMLTRVEHEKYIVEVWLPVRHLVQCRLTEERRWCSCDKAVKGFFMLYIEGCYMYMGSHIKVWKQCTLKPGHQRGLTGKTSNDG